MEGVRANVFPRRHWRMWIVDSICTACTKPVVAVFVPGCTIAPQPPPEAERWLSMNFKYFEQRFSPEEEHDFIRSLEPEFQNPVIYGASLLMAVSYLTQAIFRLNNENAAVSDLQRITQAAVMVLFGLMHLLLQTLAAQ